MKHWRRNSLILLALCATTALVAAPVMLASDRDEKRDRRVDRSTVRISSTDDEGNRQEEVFEFDDEHPEPLLGVNIENADGRGARVESVLEGTPAERAGLREGDVIVGFDGARVDSAWDLTRRVWRSGVGQSVELEVERDGGTERVTVELGQQEFRGGAGFDFDFHGIEIPDHDFDFDFDFDFATEQFEQHMQEMERHFESMKDMKLDMDFDFPGLGHLGAFGFSSRRPILGIELVETTPELREHLGGDSDTGVLVGRVEAGMPAEAAGLRVGDMIVKVGGDAIENASDLRRALDDRQGQSFSIEVLRDKRTMSLDVTLPSRDDEDDEADEGTPEASRPRVAPARRVAATDRT